METLLRRRRTRDEGRGRLGGDSTSSLFPYLVIYRLPLSLFSALLFFMRLLLREGKNGVPEPHIEVSYLLPGFNFLPFLFIFTTTTVTVFVTGTARGI
ncbi:hypothetical protein EDC01DRAFT_181710 [Geopyxis carbonaria]|nr:hypothetical protein EDC01DRAFT_181710 [Geopyxis carbonaria]